MKTHNKLRFGILRGLSYVAVALMLIYGFHRAGNGDPESVARGMIGMALVGVPSLLLIWILDILTRKIISRNESSDDADE